MSRRANGEGSIYRLPNGKWRIQVEVPAVPGCSRRRRIRHCNTKAEAVAKLQELRDEATREHSDEKTIGQLIDAWLADGRSSWAPATIAQRQAVITKYLRPQFESESARTLKPFTVAEFFRTLECGHRVKQVAFDVFRMACDYGVAMEFLSRNPCAACRRPSCGKPDIHPFEPAEVERIIEQANGTRWHALLVLMITCGPRQSEAFGLEWSKVDLAAAKMRIDVQAADVGGKVHIRKPKTESGVRTFDLPKVAIEALISHRAILLKEGLAGGSLVFPAPEGGYMDRGRFRTRVWVPLLKRLGLTHRGAHHLRHTYATLALGAGVPPHVVSHVMGHSRVSTTLDLYAKAIPSQTAEASDVMQKLFG